MNKDDLISLAIKASLYILVVFQFILTIYTILTQDLLYYEMAIFCILAMFLWVVTIHFGKQIWLEHKPKII